MTHSILSRLCRDLSTVLGLKTTVAVFKCLMEDSQRPTRTLTEQGETMKEERAKIGDCEDETCRICPSQVRQFWERNQVFRIQIMELLG